MTCSCCDQYFSDEKCCQIKLLFFSFVNKYVFTINANLVIFDGTKSNLNENLLIKKALVVSAVLCDCYRESLGLYNKLLAGLNFRL